MRNESVELVSVIIPFYNRLDFFSDAINSIYNQSYRPIEIIIVDNGSDETVKKSLNYLINGYKDKDEKISLVFFEINIRGACAARNFGYKQSNGNFIQFFDSDDILLPDKISEQINVLNANEKLDLVYSKAQFVDENLIKKEEYWGRKLENNSFDYFLFPYQTMCPLYKKSAIEKYGLWDEELSINQDWEFALRYVINGANVLFQDKALCLFRQHTKGSIGKFESDESRIVGKWKSTNKIYDLLAGKNKLDKILKKLFIKRWMYIFLLASKYNYSDLTKQFSADLKKRLSTFNYFLFIPFKWNFLSSIMLKIYATKQSG